jgi:molecular chaperone HtpG
VDASFINQMEQKWENIQFTRVDSDIAENLVDVQEKSESLLSEADAETLKELFNVPVNGLQVSVDVKGLSPDAPPVMATRPEFMRRMKDMASMSGPMGSFYANMPDEVNLTVNGNHPLYRGILQSTDEEARKKQVRNLADLALLSQGLLKGASLTEFINRSIELMAGKNESDA